MSAKPKLIPINLFAARRLVRILNRYEVANCQGCDGSSHESACPSREAYQLRNYLTLRINNPNRRFKI